MSFDPHLLSNFARFLLLGFLLDEASSFVHDFNWVLFILCLLIFQLCFYSIVPRYASFYSRELCSFLFR